MLKAALPALDVLDLAGNPLDDDPRGAAARAACVAGLPTLSRLDGAAWAHGVHALGAGALVEACERGSFSRHQVGSRRASGES